MLFGMSIEAVAFMEAHFLVVWGRIQIVLVRFY